MSKVLLVYEDFNELTLTETLLKKVGFDVLGTANEVLLADKILTFNPAVVVAFGSGSKVSSISVGAKLKDQIKYSGKLILIFSKEARPQAQEMLKVRMDGILEAPVDAPKLVQALCRVLGHPVEPVLEKLQKAKLTLGEGDQKMRIITNNPKVPLDDADRMKRYQKFTKELTIDPQATSHSRQEMKEKMTDLKKGFNYDLLEEIDELKRKFAEALFKKNK